MGPMGLSLNVLVIFILLCAASNGKLTENDANENVAGPKLSPKSSDGAVLMFADELKGILEKYILGICPQNYKVALGAKRNMTAAACDLDAEQADLPGRLATLALRAHSAARSDCSRLSMALANTLGELARTASNQQAANNASAAEANKKRKLSKSQKAKLQAKQRTALAVKKKAAALAAAAAAKMAS